MTNFVASFYGAWGVAALMGRAAGGKWLTTEGAGWGAGGKRGGMTQLFFASAV
jgi:hypothetical protein